MTTGQIPDTLPRAELRPSSGHKVDVLVIGAGPTGLACGIEAQRAGFNVLIVDKGCLVNSLYNYPANMTFFTTPELLEIGDIPFSTAHQKPTREEALEEMRVLTAAGEVFGGAGAVIGVDSSSVSSNNTAFATSGGIIRVSRNVIYDNNANFSIAGGTIATSGNNIVAVNGATSPNGTITQQ